MQNGDIIINPALAWVLAGLISLLILTVGFFGKKIYDEVRNIARSVAQQEIYNKWNEEEHEDFKRDINDLKKSVLRN